MIEALLAILWFSIGIGVFSVFNAKHGDGSETPTGLIVCAAILWPAFVVAEIYRHATRKKGGDA